MTASASASGYGQARPGLFTPVLIGGAVIVMLSFAVRGSFGVFQIPIGTEFAWPRAEFSMAIAIQNLAWGVSQPAFAALGDRRVPAVLAAVALFDADHVGAVFGEQRGAVRSGDVATEVEDANAFQRQAHAGLLSCARARRVSS